MNFPTSLEIILWLLFFNYCYLNWRLYRLQKSMEKFDKRFQGLENLFATTKDNIVLIVEKLKHLEVLKTAVIKFSATTPIGPVDAEISLAKLLENKEDAASTDNQPKTK